MAYTPDLSSMRSAYAQQLADQQKKALRGTQDIFAQRGTTGSGEEALAFGETGRQFGLGAGAAEASLQQYMGQLGEQQRQFDINQGLAQQQFGLSSELGRGGLGLQQQQLAQQGSQFGQQLAQQGSQFGQSLSEQQRQYNIANQLAQGQFGLQQAQVYGGGQYGGQYTPTQSSLQQQFAQNLSLLPFITQGYLSPEQAYGTSRVAGAGGRGFQSVPNQPFGQITTEQQLSPEHAYAQQLGMNPYQMSLLSSVDPGYLSTLIKGNVGNQGYNVQQQNVQNMINEALKKQQQQQASQGIFAGGRY